MAGKLADRRLYFTADKSELVEEGDPDAAFLAATPGRPLPDAPIRKSRSGPAEDKAVQAPTADKSDDDVHVCGECGFEAKTAGGLASHERSHDD